MHLTRLTCPKCRAILKPAKPVPEGKTIKCPKCEELFKAGEAPGSARGSPATTAKKPAEAAAAKAEDDDDGEMYGVIKDEAEERKKAESEQREARKRRMRRRKRAGEEIDEEDEEDEENDPEYDLLKHYLESVKSKDPRGPAQARVVTPSNWLLATGLIGFFGWAIVLIFFMIPIAFPILHDDDPSMQKEGAAEKTNPKDKDKDKDKKSKPQEVDLAVLIQQQAWSVVLFVFVLLVGLAQAGAIAYGAVNMQSLTSFRWSITSCVLTIFPLHMVPVWVGVWWVFESFLFDEMQWAPACLVFAWGPLVGGLCLKAVLNPIVKAGFFYRPD